MSINHMAEMRRDSDGSASPGRNEAMKNPVLKTVVKTLAREMLKKSVPKQVFLDCADAINKAFCVDNDRM